MYLNNLNLGVGEANLLRNFVASSTNIKNLYLSRNSLGVEGARILGEGLAQNLSLEVLDLDHNRIRNKGALAIASSLFEEGRPSKIRVLSLKNNFISEKSFKELVRLLMGKCGPFSDISQFHLRALLIAGNVISLFELKHLYKIVLDRKVPLFVDGFERIKHNEDSCLFLS